MSKDDLHSANTLGAPPSPRRNGRPIDIGGGPAGYLENGLNAAAQPFRGITSDGSVISGLFPVKKTGVSTQPIREAAEDFLGSLKAAQRDRAVFPIDTIEWRKWSNIHRTIMRHGIPFFEMGDNQLDRAYALLKESLSSEGFDTARDIIHLNETVGEMTGRFAEYGDDLYWLSIMGTPSATEPWGWQIDGHHLIINFFVLGDQVVMTPSFLGSEPVHAEGGKYAGTRVFRSEEARGLALMQALSSEQRSKAVIAQTLPRDVFTTAFRDNFELHYEGICYDALSGPQHDLLLRVIEVHVGRLRSDHAQIKLAEVKRHLSETYFAWMGGMEQDSVFYYRVHSPVLLVEFDHQAGQAFRQYKDPYKDHIHIVVRTPNGNDYGKDLLRQHYEQSRHHKPS
jgi:hypothetical protein